MSVLGCVGHTATIVSRGGATVATLDGMSEIRWERRLDELSEAVATVSAGGDCCEQLGTIRPWANDLIVWRGGVAVWRGPITRVEWEQDFTTISATDVGAWLGRRTLTDVRTFTDDDMTTVAEAVIAEGFSRHDPGHSVQVVGLSGVRGDREFEPDRYVLDLLRDLGDSGLDWTVLGSTILLMAEDTCEVVASLDDWSFADPLRVVSDGLSFASEAKVRGQDDLEGIAGGVDPYFGLVQVLTDDATVTSQQAVDEAARSVVSAVQPEAVFIETGDRARIRPDAPIEISDMVPGWCITAVSTSTCRTLTATLRIAEVTVRENVDDGETIDLRFVPRGANVGGL